MQMARTYHALALAARGIVGVILWGWAVGDAGAQDGYLTAQPQANTNASEAAPNYFVEEPAGAQPLNQPLAEQPAVATQAMGLQYPEQAAVLVQSDEAALAEPASPPATSQPLKLSPPSADPAAEQRAKLSQPMITGAASLGIVLGLFLLVVLVTRRGLPKGVASLPKDVVEVLGRAPFVGRQQVHLVRCANKVLLVCVSPTSAQTLTEITDPHEVEQLLMTCRGTHGGGAAFEKILHQFGQPPHAAPADRRFAGRHGDGEVDFSHLEVLQHSSRGGRA
jgi:flagellar biogenesis protein FliO